MFRWLLIYFGLLTLLLTLNENPKTYAFPDTSLGNSRQATGSDPAGYGGLGWRTSKEAVRNFLTAQTYKIKLENSLQIIASKGNQTIVYDFGPTLETLGNDPRQFTPVFADALWRVQLPLIQCSVDRSMNKTGIDLAFDTLTDKYGSPSGRDYWVVGNTLIRLKVFQPQDNCQSLSLIYETLQIRSSRHQHRTGLANQFWDQYDPENQAFMGIGLGDQWKNTEKRLLELGMMLIPIEGPGPFQRVIANESSFARLGQTGRVTFQYLPFASQNSRYPSLKGKIVAIQMESGALPVIGTSSPNAIENVSKFLDRVFLGEIPPLTEEQFQKQENNYQLKAKWMIRDQWFSLDLAYQLEKFLPEALAAQKAEAAKEKVPEKAETIQMPFSVEWIK